MKKKNIFISKFNKPECMEYTVRNNTDKEIEKFIKRIEKNVRSSMEYRDYISYLKEYVDMNHCAFYTNMDNNSGGKVKIEIHHEPFTLFDISKIVYNKFIIEGFPLNDLYIAEEIMDLHYTNQVGLIPLSKSIHQIYHNSNQIVIPLNLVYGDYMSFCKNYNDYITDEQILDKLERKINETKGLKSSDFNKLNPKYVYIEVDGFTLPQKIAA